MAAANSDQENVLLPNDEGSPSVTPPQKRLAIKSLLFVGICVAAASLAGAVVMGRPIARAPAKIRPPWNITGLSDETMAECTKHFSKECCILMTELMEESAGAPFPPTSECKASEKKCSLTLNMDESDFKQTMCMPNACKQSNIVKYMNAGMPPEAANLDVSCELTSACSDCGYVPNANVGETGKETVTFVGIGDGGKKCCDECKAKLSEDPPCAAWVYIHDGHCYQKYDTGIPIYISSYPDSAGSDAGILKPAAPSCTDCGYVPNANVGWTGKETVTFVGIGTEGGQKCCDECKAKLSEDPPCAAWVYIHDGHCYQKYDTGIPVEMSDGPDSAGSDAGILITTKGD